MAESSAPRAQAATAAAHEAVDEKVDSSDSSVLRTRLASLIKEIVKDHKVVDGARRLQAAELTRQHILKIFDNPKVVELELVLRKRLTQDEARHILFFPDEDQAAFYPTLIAELPKSAPFDHPQRALQIPHLSFLYLQHWKRWNFASAFVLSGGLHSLCTLFTHENLVVRMNAINTVVNITAHQDFDWFRLPHGTTESRLHRALLGLRNDPTFLSGLIANSWAPDLAPPMAAGKGKGTEGDGGRANKGKSFPGGCLISLELLAMWLSWVRKLHTVDCTLRLSRALFRAIESWGGSCDENGGKSTTSSGHGGGWRKGPWEVKEVTENTEEIPECTDSDNSNSGTSTQDKMSASSEMASPTVQSTTDQQNARDKAQTQDEKEEAALQASERAEWEQVIKLSKKLVEDFGRFPFAEEAWKEVRPVSETDDARSRDNVEDQNQANTAKPLEATSASTTSTTISAPGDEQGEDADVLGEDVSSPSSVAIQKAEQLKAEGNEAFGAGSFEAARVAYSAALDTLREFTVYTRQQDVQEVVSPTLVSDTVESTQNHRNQLQDNVCSVLRGVLHRNRAAAMLRLFDRAIEVQDRTHAGAAENESSREVHGERLHSERTGSAFGNREPRDERIAGQSTNDGSLAPAPGREVKEDEAGADATKLPLSSSSSSLMALLEQCESDCLRAIEIDTTDKKASFRLARCRDLRRRETYRRSSAKDRGGAEVPADFTRRQERKAALMAKILARQDYSGSQGFGKSSTSTEIITDKETTKDAILTGSAKSAKSAKPTARFSTVTVEHPLRSTGDEVALRPVPISTDQERSGDAVVAVATERDARFTIPGDAKLSSVISERSAAHQRSDTRNPPAPREGGELTEMIPKRLAVKKSAKHTIKNESEVQASTDSTTSSTVKASRGTSRLRPLRRRLGRLIAASSCERLVANTRAATTTGVGYPLASTMRGSSSCQRDDDRQLRKAKDQRSAECEGHDFDERNSHGRRMWEFLMSLSSNNVSLGRLFGDGITEEELKAVTHGLKHALDQSLLVETTTTSASGAAITAAEHALKVFIELGQVKRVGLVAAMSSPANQDMLQEVYFAYGGRVSSHCDNGSGTHGGGGCCREKRVFASDELTTEPDLKAVASALGLQT